MLTVPHMHPNCHRRARGGGPSTCFSQLSYFSSSGTLDTYSAPISTDTPRGGYPVGFSVPRLDMATTAKVAGPLAFQSLEPRENETRFEPSPPGVFFLEVEACGDYVCPSVWNASAAQWGWQRRSVSSDRNTAQHGQRRTHLSLLPFISGFAVVHVVHVQSNRLDCDDVGIRYR